MKALGLGELGELLHGSAFAGWWTEFQRLSAAAGDARAHRDELAAAVELMALRSELAQRAALDAFSRAGDVEGEGTRWAAEAQAHENRALAAVGEFEQQRARTSELWVRLEAAAPGAQDPRLAEEYRAAERRRDALWADVEAAWAASFERALVGAERGVEARRVRRDAERLFAEAEERRRRAAQLAADAGAAGRALDEAEAQVAAALEDARARFECVPGRAWLYWRDRDHDDRAFALALADDPGGAHLGVKALDVRVVGRLRGVDALETP